MFCIKCGTQLPDDACFCFKCGHAMNQNTQQTTAYQQPNTYHQPSYNEPPETFSVNLVYPDKHNEIGDIRFTATEMIFFKKSKGVAIAFGFVGRAIENGKEVLRLNLADVVSGGKTRIGINPHVYQLTFRDGSVYKLCIDNPVKLAYMQRRFG